STVEAAISDLRSKMSTTVADLVRQGLDAEVMATVTNELQGDLHHLERRRLFLARRGESAAAARERLAHLIDLATAAERSIAAASDEDRRNILKLAGAQVRLLRWSDCEGCDGSGRHWSVRGVKLRKGMKRPPCDDCGGTGRVADVQVRFEMADATGSPLL